MKRSHMIALAGTVLVVAVAIAVWITAFPQRVQVMSGVRVECVYGHVVSDNVRSISVRPSVASEYGVQKRTIVCAEHAKAELRYGEAQAAIARGDLKTAKTKLAEVVAIDSDFKKASGQLAQLDSGETPKVDTDTAGKTTPSIDGDDAAADDNGSKDASGEPVGPVASLMKWTPDTIEGFVAEQVTADTLGLSRDYRASAGDRTLVIAAEQLGSAQAVKEELRTAVRLRYDRDARELKVKGRPAYVGSDGSAVAVLGIEDGSVLVVLQLTDSEVKPSSSIDRLVDIAEALPR